MDCEEIKSELLKFFSHFHYYLHRVDSSLCDNSHVGMCNFPRTISSLIFITPIKFCFRLYLTSSIYPFIRYFFFLSLQSSESDECFSYRCRDIFTSIAFASVISRTYIKLTCLYKFDIYKFNSNLQTSILRKFQYLYKSFLPLTNDGLRFFFFFLQLQTVSM